MPSGVDWGDTLVFYNLRQQTMESTTPQFSIAIVPCSLDKFHAVENIHIGKFLKDKFFVDWSGLRNRMFTF